jgi:peptidoglycan/LPS O-acetylase OafA/YrhL
MYALYPLFFRFAQRGAWRTLGISVGLMYAFTILLLRVVTPYWVFNSVFMFAIFWFLGAYAAHLFVRGRQIRGLWPALAWIGFIVLKKIPHFHGLNLLIQLTYGVTCALGILWMVNCEQRRPAPSPNHTRNLLCFTGRISYSLYAVHTPVLLFTTWALLVLADSHSYSWQLATGLIVSLGMTLAVYYGVERTFYRPRN